jgi:hypothetical protein
MSIEKYNSIIHTHTRLFRQFTKEYGRNALRMVLYALENQQSSQAIAAQLDLPLSEIQHIKSVFQKAA